MKYTILERFGAFSNMELMNDFDLRELFENFKALRQNPLYSDFLEEYVFDKNGMSNELASDITSIISKDNAMITNNKSLYFNLDFDFINEVIDNTPNKQIYYSFVKDYRELLTQKELSKQR